LLLNEDDRNQPTIGGSVLDPKPPIGSVAQVAHLSVYPEDVSGCSTASYEFSCLVRNDEVAGSTPVSSTIFSIT
jgi:hypothetical protein